MMTKKHYIEIAEIIERRTGITESSHDIIKLIIKDLCNYFIQDNPLFDSEKFKKACGVLE